MKQETIEKYDKFKDIFLKAWMLENQGLGITKLQIMSLYISELKISTRNKLLRLLRKEKKIYYSRKRWFMSSSTYNLYKEPTE